MGTRLSRGVHQESVLIQMRKLGERRKVRQAGSVMSIVTCSRFRLEGPQAGEALQWEPRLRLTGELLPIGGR
jgi:hypothetical protein